MVARRQTPRSCVAAPSAAVRRTGVRRGPSAAVGRTGVRRGSTRAAGVHRISSDAGVDGPAGACPERDRGPESACRSPAPDVPAPRLISRAPAALPARCSTVSAIPASRDLPRPYAAHRLSSGRQGAGGGATGHAPRAGATAEPADQGPGVAPGPAVVAARRGGACRPDHARKPSRPRARAAPPVWEGYWRLERSPPRRRPVGCTPYNAGVHPDEPGNGTSATSPARSGGESPGAIPAVPRR
jgi:hypothetical protein